MELQSDSGQYGQVPVRFQVIAVTSSRGKGEGAIGLSSDSGQYGQLSVPFQVIMIKTSKGLVLFRDEDVEKRGTSPQEKREEKGGRRVLEGGGRRVPPPPLPACGTEKAVGEEMRQGETIHHFFNFIHSFDLFGTRQLKRKSSTLRASFQADIRNIKQ